MTTQGKTNIIKILEDRRINIKSNLRKNEKIVKHLICQPEAKFTKIWEKRSKNPIAFEDGRLFFDNYRTSYSVNGIGFKPTMMYKLGSVPSKQRIEDATLSRFTLETLPLAHKGWRPCLLAVSQDNYLSRYDLDTGQILQQVFLSSCYKFRHLGWNNLGHSIVVKSIQMKSPLSHSQLSRAGQDIPNVLLAVAMFNVYPLEFVGVAEITRKIFGKDIVDAMITEGMLLVMHQNNLLKMYSWERLIEKSLQYKALLDAQCRQLDEGIVGSRSAGLPLNIIISECPPVLFEVKCQDHSLVLGGIPWHYIMCPPGKQSQFHVYSVEDNSLAKNGRLKMDGLSVEPDKCIFHADDSGRVIHIGANEVKVLRLRENEGAKGYSLHEEFCINAEKLQPKVEVPPLSEIGITSSGRRVKRSISYVEDSVQCDLESIQLVDYEDDLDLFVVTAVHQKEDTFTGTMYLHNNLTGEVLKEITLDEPWLEFYTHDVTLDMDKIVHTVAGPGRKFDCYVYQLDLRPKEDSVRRKSDRIKAKNIPGDAGPRTRQSTGRRARHQNTGFYNEDSDN